MSPQKSTSPSACSIGLPISFTTIAASVSRRSRWSSPTRRIFSARSATERDASASRASQALAMAASSSSFEISGYSSSFSPVAGLTTAYMLLVFVSVAIRAPGVEWSSFDSRRCAPAALAGGGALLERLLEAGVLVAGRIGDRRVGDPAVGDVDARAQARVQAHGLLQPVVRERQRVGHGRVGERV